MATLVQAYRPTRFDGLLILKGFLCSLLVAVVRYADSVLWHCCHSLNGEPFCCSTVTKHCRQPSSMNLLLPESVHTFFGLDGPCHISSWYVQSIVLGYFAVDIRGHFHRGLPHIVASTRLDCASSGYGMQDVRIGLNQYLGVQARLSPGKKDTRSDTRQELVNGVIDDAPTMRVLFYHVPTQGEAGLWMVQMHSYTSVELIFHHLMQHPAGTASRID